MSQGDELFGSIYERGSVVFRQGDPGDSMYIVQSGAVEISRIQGEREMVIALREKGDFFGEMALIDKSSRSATAIAISRTRLLPLTRSSLLKRLRQDPQLVKYLLAALSRRITETTSKLRSTIEGDDALLSARETSRGPLEGSLTPHSDAAHQLHVPARISSHEEPVFSSAEVNFAQQESVVFQRGEAIFDQDEPGDTMYIIAEGEVQIIQKTGKGKRVLAVRGPHEIIGEIGLISSSLRTASAVATRKTRLFPVGREEFFERIRREPGLALYVLQVLIVRLRHAVAAIAEPKNSMDLVHQMLPPLLKKKESISMAFVSLSACGGCVAAVLDEQDELSSLLQRTNVSYCPLLMDQGEITEVEVAVVDGTVRVREDQDKLMEARRKSRYLLAWGTCAAFGGVPAMANQYELEDLLERSYGQTLDPFAHYLSGAEGIEYGAYQDEGLALLRRAGKLDDFVKVDYFVAGCPPRVSLLNQLLKELRGEPQDMKSQKIVCAECRRKPSKGEVASFQVFPGSEWKAEHCLTSDGVMCLGFLTKGGCGAYCVRGGLPCWGCRGLSKAILQKLEKGDSLESLLLNSLARRCRLDEEQIKPVMKIVRHRTNSMLNFYQNFASDRTRLR
jgi:F420-non-reducing hydrogenase small subunit